MDAVQQAASRSSGRTDGHGGHRRRCCGAIFSSYNPGNPGWWDRDRFVLSNGHASMLLYSLLYLTGYPHRLDELRHFRQLGSRTAGHPEHEVAMGVETTTGPLGQGLANAVGHGAARRRSLAATFNRPGYPIVDHHTYVFVGDGCLMEGISHEVLLARRHAQARQAASASTTTTASRSTARSRAGSRTTRQSASPPIGWHVARARSTATIPTPCGRDCRSARAVTDRPSMICCRTDHRLGRANKQGTEATHRRAARRRWKSPPRARTWVGISAVRDPGGDHAQWDARECRRAGRREWQQLFAALPREYPELAAEFERRMRGELPPDSPTQLPRCIADAAQQALQRGDAPVLAGGAQCARAQCCRSCIGGSADLTGSNNTRRKDSRHLHARGSLGRLHLLRRA